MLSTQEKRELDSIFYGKDFLMKGFEAFKSVVKNIPEDKVKYYYDNQEIVRLFKPVGKTKHYVSISASYPFEKVYMDTMTITHLNLTLITGIDLFSKYGFCRVLGV